MLRVVLVLVIGLLVLGVLLVGAQASILASTHTCVDHNGNPCHRTPTCLLCSPTPEIRTATAWCDNCGGSAIVPTSTPDCRKFDPQNPGQCIWPWVRRN